jgi:release factor glutamine methyltransferase
MWDREAVDDKRASVTRTLADAGFVAAAEEAGELLRAAGDGAGELDDLLERRLRGEPLAWIVGSTVFCEIRVRIDPGVYVPRAQTERLARRAVSLLSAHGVAVDLCTGSGAIGAVLLSERPAATVIATDRDPVAVACARRNGVEALIGNLDEPLPRSLEHRVDVLTAVPPYVPTEELHLLPRDLLAFEPRDALDGGPGGTAILERVIGLSPRWLRPGGTLLVEIGGDQAEALAPPLEDAGLAVVEVHCDAEGDDRGLEARLRE